MTLLEDLIWIFAFGGEFVVSVHRMVSYESESIRNFQNMIRECVSVKYTLIIGLFVLIWANSILTAPPPILSAKPRDVFITNP